jgi:hypothetical protein
MTELNAYDMRLIIKALREKGARYVNPEWRKVTEELIERLAAASILVKVKP